LGEELFENAMIISPPCIPSDTPETSGGWSWISSFIRSEHEYDTEASGKEVPCIGKKLGRFLEVLELSGKIVLLPSRDRFGVW
jgi:hypothetical protein